MYRYSVELKHEDNGVDGECSSIRFYSVSVLDAICPMIIGKAKHFQNGCRIRHWVEIVLAQNRQLSLSDGNEERRLSLEINPSE